MNFESQIFELVDGTDGEGPCVQRAIANAVTTKKDGTLGYDWYQILHQDELWWDARGKVKQIKFLDDGYLRNIVAFIERLPERTLFSFMMHVVSGATVSGMEDHFADEEYDLEWIRYTPLHRALTARLEGRADRRFEASEQVRFVRFLEFR